MTIEDALPCPFCESSNTAYDPFEEYVYCTDCGMSGPQFCDNEEDAVKEWNRLPRSDSSSELEQLIADIENAANTIRDAVGAESSLQAECDYVRTTRPRRILKLITELRQTRAERDWLARQLSFEKCCVPSELKEEPGYCLEHDCVECGLSSADAWLKVAKKEVNNATGGTKRR